MGRIAGLSKRSLARAVSMAIEALEQRRFFSAGQLDLTYGTNGIVTTDFPAANSDTMSAATAVGNSGKVVAVGTTDGAPVMARYSANGSRDGSFGSNGYVLIDSSVLQVALTVTEESDGKLIVGGSLNGEAAVARFDANGSVDTSFGTNGVTTIGAAGTNVNSLAIDSQGRIVGSAASSGDFAAIRLTDQGDLDTDFGGGSGYATVDFGDDDVSQAVAIDGLSIVLAGSTGQFEHHDLAVARLSEDGTPDPSFNGTGQFIFDLPGPANVSDDDFANAVAVQPGGGIVVGGMSNDDFVLLRLLENGTPDPNFGDSGTAGASATDISSGGVDDAKALALDSDGNIILAGVSAGDLAIARYTSGGLLDGSFNATGTVTRTFDGSSIAQSLIVAGDNSMRAFGDAGTTNANFDFASAAYDSTGAVNNSYGDGGAALDGFIGPKADSGYAITQDSSGRTIMAGVSSPNNNQVLALSRYLADGSLDSTFGTGGRVTQELTGQDTARAVTVDSTGRILVGFTSSSGGSLDFGLARFSDTGALQGYAVVPTPGNDDDVRAIAVNAGGDIYVAGVQTIDGEENFEVVKFDSNGILDGMFAGTGAASIDFNDDPEALTSFDELGGMALQSDGTIVLAGFTFNGTNTDIGLALLDGGGSVNRLVVTDLGSEVGTCVTVDGSDNIYVGGIANGGGAVLKYDSAGDLDTEFGSGGVAAVNIEDQAIPAGIAVLADSSLVVAANATNFNTFGQDFGVAHLNSDGSPDTEFGPGGSSFVSIGTPDTTNTVAGLVIQPSGRIVLGGTTDSRDFALAGFEGQSNPPTVDAGGDQTVNEGDTVHFAVSESSGDAPLDYAWDLDGDEQFDDAAGPTASFVYSDDSTVTVSVQVTDVHNLSSVDSLIVTVQNVAPTLGVTGTGTANEGSGYTISLSSSDPGTDTIVSWSINWGDGPTDPISGNPNSASHTYADNGIYTITSSATDEDGSYAAPSHVVTVANVAPNLSTTGTGVSNEGSAYTISLASSDPGTDTIVSWTINWGDDNTVTVSGNPTSATHTYADNGNYTILASATDEDGTFAAPSTTVSVANVARTLSVTGSGTSNEGSAYTVSLASSDPGTDTIVSWSINWGDGNTVIVVGHPASATHTYADNGNYTILASATDEDGTFAAPSTTVSVANVAPTLGVTGTGASNEGSGYTVSLSSSDPGADTIASWTVNWGDGITQTIVGHPSSASHTYADNGNYTIHASATDEDGTFAAGVHSVAVANLVPVASISGPSSIQLGVTGTFTLGATDPSAADQAAAFTFAIDWDGNGTVDQTVIGAAGTTVTHIFSSSGSFTVKVNATDKDGGTSTAAATLPVTVTSVVTAQVISDPVNAGQTMLVVTGTSGDDEIKLKQLNNGGIEVKSSGVVLGTYFPTARIVVNAGEGNDKITDGGSFNRPIELYGNNGNDTLTAGDSGDILVGGSGADVLNGGSGRDLMIGGDGADKINGDAGDDILIAGSTSYDNDPASLNKIEAEWNSSRSYASRVANIQGISNPDFAARLNGSVFLIVNGPGTNVFDDGVKDTLNGDQGTDWFLFNNDSGVLDKIADLKSGEIGTDID